MVLQYLDSARFNKGFMNMSECYAHLRLEGILLSYFSNPDIPLFLSVQFPGVLALFWSVVHLPGLLLWGWFFPCDAHCHAEACTLAALKQQQLLDAYSPYNIKVDLPPNLVFSKCKQCIYIVVKTFFLKKKKAKLQLNASSTVILRRAFTRLARRATLQSNPLISIGKSFKGIEIGLITENRLLSYCLLF